jgi:hypothetical protein
MDTLKCFLHFVRYGELPSLPRRKLLESEKFLEVIAHLSSLPNFYRTYTMIENELVGYNSWRFSNKNIECHKKLKILIEIENSLVDDYFYIHNRS